MRCFHLWLGTWLSLLAAGVAAGESASEATQLLKQAQQYEHGRLVKQDYREAYRLYCRAALLGDPMAAFNLGWMYFNGRGLPRKADVAVGWFKRAAKTGDPYAARMLVQYAGINAAEDADCQPEPPPLPVMRAAAVAHPKQTVIASWVDRIAPRYAVDPELVMAVIQAESGFRITALSPKNAQGLMQLIPATAERFGVKEPWDPQENIRGGTAYLHWLLRHFQGNVEWTLAAYNAGEHTVEQYHGVPPYQETRSYVQRILANYRKTVHPVPPPL